MKHLIERFSPDNICNIVYLANPGEARDCFTNIVVISSLNDLVCQSPFVNPQIYGTAKPKRFEIVMFQA